ncbi:MAG TPA: permease-like cell division protein FtsX [Candidatus Acidoferrum sp.]|nr:permease-like cell division protein FtsX [Candidatus Acidoferrum sp.]
MAKRPETRSATAPVKQGGLVTALGQHQGAAVDSLQRLLREPLGTLLAALVIGIALALPLSLFLMLQNVKSLGAGIDQHGSIAVFMREKEPNVLARTQKQLQQRHDIKSIRLITPDQALQEFETKSGFGEALATLDANPLPPLFDIVPASEQSKDVAALVKDLQALPGVDVVQADLNWLERLNAIVAVAQRIALMLAGVLGIGVVLVIGNTVRLAIANRSAEIVVVKLVGGTDAYVSRPFLYTGFWYGVGGGLIAVVLVSLFLWVLSGPVTRLLASYGASFALQGLGVGGGFVVVVLAGALGWLGAFISVLRHLRAIEPR